MTDMPRVSEGKIHHAVSVVICCYTTDRWSQLVASVESVLSQHPGPHEVLVVVDHCPHLESLVRGHFGERVVVVANAGRRGLSGARNTGVAAASADIVAFLDDDAWAEPGWLGAHAEMYDDPGVIGAGGLVRPIWAREAPRWFPPEFGWVVGCSYAGQPGGLSEIRNPIGANMSFRSSALATVGGFSEELGRVGKRPAGCEETELSIRMAGLGRIVHQPAAVAHHHVSDDRTHSAYFRRRCWAEGLSKARVSQLCDQRGTLSTEREYATRTLPRSVGRYLVEATRHRDLWPAMRAGAVIAGLAVTSAAYAAGTLTKKPKRRPAAADVVRTNPGAGHRWWSYDVHGRVGLCVDRDAPAALQLRTMLACFATDRTVPCDIAVSKNPEPMVDPSVLEDDLRYTEDAVLFVEESVQIVRDAEQFRIHGPGELLTSLVPVLDRVMVQRGAAMIHAATVGYRGHAILMPAAGGTGKTSTVAKMVNRPGYSFMGDDWGFVSDNGEMLGYAKPMFIKPHHRGIYPHLFQGARKPTIPSSLSRPVGRLTTLVHPAVIRYPRLADAARRWSPEHRMVRADQALPGVPVTTSAPVLVAVYVERYAGETSRLLDVDRTWMADRLMGNFHIEMASFSQQVVTSLAATNMVSWRDHTEAKLKVLDKGLEGIPCFLLQVPVNMSADDASDDVVRVMDRLLADLVPHGAEGS